MIVQKTFEILCPVIITITDGLTLVLVNGQLGIFEEA
jgi:hypothetical protein